MVDQNYTSFFWALISFVKKEIAILMYLLIKPAIINSHFDL